KLMVRRFAGRIDRDPKDLARSSLELSVEADSLAVVDEASQDDRSEIEREMNEKVLEVKRFPRIEFKSTSLSERGSTKAGTEVVLEGDLDLHGVTRRIRVPGTLAKRGQELRITGEIRLKQSDHGIKPTSVAGGTIKVADEVRLTFDLVARPR